ncbi:MAG: TolC family protein, partial [Bdellovibrionota bacterium]
LNVQRLKKRLDSIDANIARNVEILKAVTAKFDSGFGIALDVMRARGLVEAEKLKQADAKYAYLKARQELANTIGEEELQGELEPLAFRELPASARSPEPEDGMERRPDLIAARQTVLAAGYLKRAAHDEWLPKISILADLGVLGTGYSIFGLGSFNNGVNGSAGVQVSIPVYTGGYHAAKEQEAGVKLLKVELDEQQLKLEAQSQIRLAEAQLTQANTAVNASNERIHIAEEELKLARQRSQTGSASGLELANSQANMAAAADMNVDAVFAYELSKVNYFKSMGRLSAYFETGVQ